MSGSSKTSQVPNAATDTRDALSTSGVVVSMVALTLVLVVLGTNARLRRKHEKQVVMHISVCLLGALVIFIGPASHTSKKEDCAPVTLALHYFLTAVFFWSFAQALVFKVGVLELWLTAALRA